MGDKELSGPERRQVSTRGWAGGLALVVLGSVVLLEHARMFSLPNWWALFILLPAFGSFATTYALYRRLGGFGHAVRGNFFGGVMVLAVALMFLTGLSWTIYWPIFVILAGLGILLAGPPAEMGGDRSRLMRLFAGPWLLCLGLGATLLGTGFLLDNLGIYNPAALFGPRWWSLVFLLAALGGLVATVRLLLADGHPVLAIISNLMGVVAVAGAGLVAWLGLDWNLLWPITLIAAGCVLLLGVWSQSPVPHAR